MSTGAHLDDEQLTALQDGEGPAADRAHLSTCGRCTERADALAAVAALVAAVPAPPPAEARDAAIAAALRSADRPVPRPARPRPRVPGWLVPAAAVVAFFAVVAALVPLLGRGGSDDDRAASGRSDQAAESSGDDAGDSGSAGGLSRSAAPSGSSLGRIDDEAALVRAVGGALAPAPAAQSDASATPTSPCEGRLRSAGGPLGPLRLRAALVWRGQPAEVLSDGERAVVVAAGGCTALASVDLP
jgi:hypothetical protein